MRVKSVWRETAHLDLVRRSTLDFDERCEEMFSSWGMALNYLKSHDLADLSDLIENDLIEPEYAGYIPADDVERLTSIFREVRRILTPDGTLWLNIADTYAGKGNQGEALDPKYPNGRTGQIVALNGKVEGCKAKDMIGVPWLLAFALRADGWYLRSDIIWMKANPMPESTKDRPSRCYEHIFLLSKSRRYYYDAAAIAEPVAETTVRRMKGARSTATKHGSGIPGQQNIQKINLPRAAGTYTDADIPQLRNKRDVWQINTVPYRGGHFAAFPPKLAETCLLAGCPPGGVVLDPFLGSGTTAAVARQLGRHYIGIELNPEYCTLAEKRIGGETP